MNLSFKLFSIDETTNFSVLEVVLGEKKDPLFRIGMCFHIDVFSIAQHETLGCHMSSVEASRHKPNFHTKILQWHTKSYIPQVQQLLIYPLAPCHPKGSQQG
jgi:hypothetical protein